MNEQTLPALKAVNAADPGMAGNKNRHHEELPTLSGSFARVAPLITGQHETLDLSEMLLRLRRREL